jgi:hypothetical protein
MTAFGFLEATRRRAKAGPSGVRRPCSQLRRVATLTPIMRANSVCDVHSLVRTARTSVGEEFGHARWFHRTPSYVPPAELHANGVFKRTAPWWSATGKAAAPQNSVSLARSGKSNSKRIASCAWLCATRSRVVRLAARGRGARTPYSTHLTMRRSMPRFTRLANGFSKKLENHAASVALHFAHGTFCRVHGTLRVTPAMEVLLSDHVEHRRNRSAF